MKSRVREKMLTPEAQMKLANFRVFLSLKDDIAQQVIAAMLYAYHLKGYRRKRINDLFDDILSVFDMPEIAGQNITSINVIDFLKEKYGVDINRVHLKAESEEEYIERITKK